MTRAHIRSLTGTLLVALAAVAGLIVLDAHEAQAVPNPTTCEGYPEKRVFIENQSWVEPQPGDPSHPGHHQQGHIHMSTCFPLMQTLTGDTLSLDVRIQLHNVTGQPIYMKADLYQNGPDHPLIKPSPVPACPVADCDQWVHLDIPLDDAEFSGWTNLFVYLTVQVEPGVRWYNIPRWFVNLDNGLPPRALGPGEPRIGGDSWITGPGPSYSEVIIDTEDFPWDFETGEMIPISGVWEPDVRFMKVGPNRVMVDPALHAMPPVFNTIYEGTGTGYQPFSIDTTLLSDGVHRLLLSSCNPTAQGGNYVNCGVLVVRFLVDNGASTTTTTTASTTTSTVPTTTTTTTVPPTVIDLEPGENLIVNCPTHLSGTVDPLQADLVCDE